jgi:hypothetical protein
VSAPAIPTFEEFKKTRVPTFEEFKRNRSPVPAASKPSGGFGHEVGEFFGTLGSDIAAIPGAVSQAVLHTPETIQAIGKQSEAEGRASIEAFKRGDVASGITRGLGWAVPVVGPMINETAAELARGEYGKGTAHLLELSVPEMAEELEGARLPKAAEEAAKVEAIAKQDAAAALRAHDKIERAVRPPNRMVNFKQNLNLSAPEVYEAQKITGKSIAEAPQGEALNWTLENVKAAKKALWEQYEKFTGGGIMADLSKASPEFRAKYERLPHSPGTMPGFSVRVDLLEQDLQVLNAKLDSWYNRFPSQRAAQVKAYPALRKLVEEANETRKIIADTLDAEGGGEGVRDLKKRYGALSEFENALWPRKVVAERQSAMSMPERFATARSAFHAAKGAVKVVGSGGTSGWGDIAGAGSEILGAKMIKEAHSTDSLLRQAFTGYKGKRFPVKISGAAKPLKPPTPQMTQQP